MHDSIDVSDLCILNQQKINLQNEHLKSKVKMSLMNKLTTFFFESSVSKLRNFGSSSQGM